MNTLSKGSKICIIKQMLKERNFRLLPIVIFEVFLPERQECGTAS